MQNETSHDCSACGGTGGQLHDGALLRTARKEHFCGGHHDGDRHLRCGGGGKSGTIPRGQVYVEWMDSAPAYGSGVRYHWHCAITQGIVGPCPVCQGSGRISDVRTARDAMVDAATLRLVAKAMLPGARYRHSAIAAASMGAAFSDDPIRATIAARAAFRAVPALREE